MERVESSRPRMVSLAHALSDVSVLDVPDSRVAVIDPAVELEAERARVLQAAVEEGLAQGMRDAERTVCERVAVIEARLSEQHEARVKTLALEQERLSALVRAIPEALQEMDQQIAATSVEVAYCAVTRVIGQQWAEKDVLTDLCQNVMRENRLSPGTLRIAPEDASRLPNLPEDLQVVPDARLQPGQCVIDSAKGRLMTGLDVRLTALRDALLDGLKQRVAP